ncbi:PLP-dependent aminotransferase family protein [Desulfonema magnum]|uniref:Aminotransferase, class I/III n=1 Tax=Desulfonema magnum TaxID=45655 RepID=A0A975GU25_9BACT|nr:PLP-dependent aminotransferase family protein [Desulfonema magnum]QTA93719.1 Aminotransferase, class I/III [Desulfonema magnum]
MGTVSFLKEKPNFQYLRLANEIESKIMEGEYAAGDKLPSLRKLHKQLRLSISTVYQAYIELERRGIVEARTKSGFYVRPFLYNVLPSPKLEKQKNATPKRVSVNAVANAIVEAMSDSDILQLGGAVPSSELLPFKQLSRTLKSVSSQEMKSLMLTYEHPSGNPELRRQIAKRTLGLSEKITADEIITTNGCIEAISLCLRAVGKAGDTIAVESPTYHGFLQLIEDLGMYALGLPTDLTSGVDLNCLEKALDRNTVRACLFNPNFQNPLGFAMPDEKKQKLVALLNHKDIPVIEDDLCGDLHFGEKRPATLKSFDKKGLVLYCASFSKTLAPGLRVGWTMPGRYTDAVRRLKLNTCLASAKLNQAVIANFLKSGSHDRHLRRLRNALKNQMSNTALAIARYFPKGTKITSPKGGLLLWVQLDEAVDSLALYQEARKQRISILPGVICSSLGKYKNCIRLSCGHPWSEKLEKGIMTLGQIISESEKPPKT